MRTSFVKKSANAFFEDKRATVLNDIKNTGNELIKKGMTVVITGKNHTNKEFLDVQFQDIIIYGVHPEDLELAKNQDTNLPIEFYTIKHHFNFKK